MVNCIYCCSHTYFYVEKTDRVSSQPYNIYKCEACSAGFVWPIPSTVVLSAYYQDAYTPRELELQKLSPAVALSKKLIQEKEYPNTTLDAARMAEKYTKVWGAGDVLDIGAGYGFLSAALIKHGCNVEALEIGHNSRKIFSELNGFKPKGVFFDRSYAEKNIGKYSAVFLSQVLEHLSFEDNQLKLINDVLKPGGVCVIAVPNFGSWLSKVTGTKDIFLIPPEHLNYFTIESLKLLAEESGFVLHSYNTVSRYDFRKLKKYHLLRFPIIYFLKLFFKASDIFQRGMFLNIYLIKK